MYALPFSAEGDCFRCVPPDPGIMAAAPGASAFVNPPGTAPDEALHTFTLDYGASRCFFRDSTTLTPLPAPVPVRLADPSGGPVIARSSTVLPCTAVPSGSLLGLHLPSFSMNLVSTAALQDAMVTTTTPGGSTLYTLATKPPQVAAFAQLSASGQVAASCSCRLLSHQTLLWHHHLGHPSLPRFRSMHSRLLVSGLPGLCLPYRPRLPLPVFLTSRGGTRVSGQGRERYFLLVVDDFTQYTTVFPLRSKGEVSTDLIPWIRTVRLQLRERFGHDLPVLRLHSDRGGGEFSSDLLRDFCRGEGITQSFTLVDSPQQNGITERRIGLVMEVAHTSMIHAAAPHFLWPFAVQYAAHQLNLWPRVSLPETSPTLRWTRKVGDASVFWVWGSLAFVRHTSAHKLSARAIPYIFLGFVPDAPGWQFYHPTSRRVLPSQDITFDESVPFYRLFPYRSTPPPPAPLFLAPVVVSGAATVAASGGAASGGAEPGGAGSEGAGSGGAELGGAESEGVESWGAEPRGAALFGGPAGASPRLSSQQLREWLVWRPHRRSGAPGAGGAGDTSAGGPAVPTGAVGTGVAGVGGSGAGDARAVGARVGGTGVGGTGGAGAGAIDPGAAGAGDTVWPRPYFVPLLHQRREPASRPVLPVCPTRCVPRSRPPPVPGTHAMALRPSSVPLRVPLPAPPESSLPEVPDPESDLVRASTPTVARLLATAVTDPYFESSTASALIAELLDFAGACCLDYATTLVAESVSASPPCVGGECALGTDVLEDRQEDFECLAAAVPRFASMLLALEVDQNAPDIPTPRSYVEAITGTYVDEVPPPGANIVDGMWIFRVKWPPGSPPAFKARYVAQGFSQRQGVDYFQTFSPTPKMTTLRVLLHVAAQRDYELHSLDFSTAFLQGSLHEEIWLRRPPGFTGTFPAGTQWSLRRPVYGLRQAPCEWHDTLRTTLAALGFAPSTADPSLFLCTDTSLLPLYVLVYVDDLVFATADTEALTLVKSKLQKKHTCTDLGELRSYLGLQITRDRARRTITLTQSHMVHHVLQRFGFYTSGMGLVLGGQGPVVLTGHADASWVDDSATQRSSQGYTFSLGSGSVSWRSTGSSSVLSSSCEAEIYAVAMAAQELRWLTYLLTNLGEQPCLPPVLYVDNKAMIALCQEHRLEHRTKHIALRYFLARELQQRGQLCLAYVATRASTADVFTKALPPCDHQRFVTVLGLLALLCFFS
ncbi:unnamed protein product [Closterium sp. NIES-53]